MAVYSMTGYASAQRALAATPAEGAARSIPARRLGLEIRSVNSRFLDLSFRLPDEFRQHEAAMRERITAKLKRGKVEVRAALESDAEGGLPDPSTRLLQKLVSLQDNIQTWLPRAAPLSVSDVIRLAGGSEGRGSEPADTVLELLDEAIAGMLAARKREGTRLAAMLKGHTAQLRILAETAAPLVPQLVEQQRQRFLERWTEAMALTEGATLPEAAQDRALSEATAFAIRIDVAEELTRLASHLDEIDRLLAKGGELGKRLDFLIQELHREANTLGSKSAVLEMTRISVDMKVLIEQMREQVQNLE
ncbi:YicC family protein [Xylophilus rhododendri]|uniref:YicC family protein n=1 Tax=Xylophilus rhododendri TaxID=2697032 RepID=A0A857J443_9BURK|nr:YicC/YloC family endoribonuclease [Xylophilus rhododendri]QHI97821.1 YicC family protein [Xylophilus rhododendri]